MAVELDHLTGEQAVSLLRSIACDWIANSGLEAFGSYQAAIQSLSASGQPLPAWLDDDGSAPDSPNVHASRIALKTIHENPDHPAHRWLQARLSELGAARGQMLDPVSLGIIGATFIGCILASRVRRIGDVEFYKGLPPELAEVLKQANNFGRGNKE